MQFDAIIASSKGHAGLMSNKDINTVVTPIMVDEGDEVDYYFLNTNVKVAKSPIISAGFSTSMISTDTDPKPPTSTPRPTTYNHPHITIDALEEMPLRQGHSRSKTPSQPGQLTRTRTKLLHSAIPPPSMSEDGDGSKRGSEDSEGKGQGKGKETVANIDEDDMDIDYSTGQGAE